MKTLPNANLVRCDDLTEEEELMLVYEVLLDAAETVNNDPDLEQFRHSATKDLMEFQNNYPEICCEYEFMKEPKC